MPFELIALTFTIVANILLGALIFARTYRRLYGWMFLGIVTTVSIWALGDIILLYSDGAAAETIGPILFYLGPLFTPLFVWYFSYAFPDDDPIPKKSLVFGIGSIIFWTILLIANIDFVFQGIERTNDLNIATPDLPGFLVYGAYLSSLFVLSFYVLRKKLINSKGIRREQISYTYYGIAVSSTLALISNVVFPLFFSKELIWLGPVFTLVAVSSISLAIVKHKLFDIRSAVLRTLLYVLLLTFVSIVYVVIVNVLIQLFAGDQSAQARNVINIIVALGVAYTFIPIKKLFDKTTNKFFFQDVYNSQEVINKNNVILVNRSDIHDILSETAMVVKDNLRVSECNYYIGYNLTIDYHTMGTNPEVLSNYDWKHLFRYIKNKKLKHLQIGSKGVTEEINQEMRLRNCEVIIPMITTGQEVGFLIAGPKLSGNEMSSQDIQLLESIADAVAIAVQNALRFEEISEFNVTLQKKIDDATSQLKRSNEKLKALDEAKDDFVSMASHQLRTPLTSVKGYLSMVLEGDAGDLNEQQRSMLDQAFTSSQRMTYLIADLLNLSRLKTGKFVIDNSPTNLAAVITQELSQVEATAEARKLMITYEEPHTFPTLMLDQTKIRQVIMNFVDNAIYYTPSGGAITLKLEELENSIEFTVHDTGIGVPAVDQHNLFTKFYRAANAKQARPDGTGLGLFMARKVIVAQGGATIFKSQAGKGSTFGFSFPKTLVTKETPKIT